MSGRERILKTLTKNDHVKSGLINSTYNDVKIKLNYNKIYVK